MKVSVRCITYRQLESIEDEILYKILIRYRSHGLGYEIFKYLEKEEKY